MPTTPAEPADAIGRVRRFNRFYTRRLGLLDRGHLDSPWSLTEVRILYELAHRDGPTAGEIGAELGLDLGYLSRLLQGLRRKGLVRATPEPGDRRRRRLTLTARGRQVFAHLDGRSSQQIDHLLSAVPAPRRAGLVEAMGRIESLLAPGADRPTGKVELRDPAPGDLGWVVERHGELYSAEHGFGAEFERLVAKVVGEFAATPASPRSRCWIATLDGVRAGSIFLMPASDEVAKLRLLLVEPWARGHGIGERLVDACLAGARSAGYLRMTLWTNSTLDAARRIYQKKGFRLVGSAPSPLFPAGQLGQTWELELR